MRRILPLAMFGALTASVVFAGQSATVTTVRMPGKNMEGIAVNPVTHKAYVLGEEAREGADDAKAVFVVDDAVLLGTKPPKVIPIPNENEYIAIDTIRNLVYVPTKFSLEQADPRGTLTVIDANTDAVIAIWYFERGLEPEGVAVDSATGVVYVAAKAPEGETPNNDGCYPWAVPIPDVGESTDVECWTSGYIYAFVVDRAATPIITHVKTIAAGDDPESLVFENGMVYAANEDDGTVTIANAVMPDGSGGDLITDPPAPLVPYSLHVFSYPDRKSVV